MSDDQKKAAGEAAAQLVESGMVVGLGTGSCAAHFVRALAARKLDIQGVPTSTMTAELATSLGIPLLELDQLKREIDLTVDGADEIGPGLSLIKGGGAALLREKLVWSYSKRCVTIAEAKKKVAVLGAFPLAIEVVRFGHRTTALRIADIAAEFDMPPARLREKDGAPVLTDGGDVIYDLAAGKIADPAALADALKSVTGLIEHGLFLDLADEALLGTDAGVERLLP